MASDPTPRHLSHIDRKDADTQRLVRDLKAGLPEAPPANRRTAPLRESRASTSDSPHQAAIERFLDRLEEPWVEYGAARKQFLRTALSSARRKEPETVPGILARENALLDEMQKAHSKGEGRGAGAATKGKPERAPTFLERLAFWWYRFQHRDLFDGARPTALLYDHFHVKLRAMATEFQPVINQVVDRLYNRDFFREAESGYADFQTYYLLSQLSAENLGAAFQSMEGAEGEGGQPPEKIRELSSFARIFLLLTAEESRPAHLVSSLRLIGARIARTEDLSPFTRDHLRVRPDDLERAAVSLAGFFSETTLPKLLAAWSPAAGYLPDRSWLERHLEVTPHLPARLALTSSARSHAEKAARELRTELKKSEDAKKASEALANDLAFAREIHASRELEATPRDRKLFEEDPLSHTNSHINTFLVLFEEHLSETSRLQFTENPQASWPLIADLKSESVKSIASFPIKQDLLGKIKKLQNQDAQEFRNMLFDPRTQMYKTFQKTVDYVKRVNARIALHFAGLFEAELRRLREHDFDRLSWHPESPELRARIAPLLELSPKIVPEGSEAPVEAHRVGRDKYGKPCVFDPDSLSSMLRLGKALCTYVAWELKDPILEEKSRDRQKEEGKFEEIRSQLSVLEDALGERTP